MEIPLVECYLDDNKNKPLIFFNHGFTSNKEQGAYHYIFELAKRGFYVVCIDAYMHGERIKEPFISGTHKTKQQHMFEVIMQTGHDIKNLYNNYYKNNFKDVYIMGESMGGAVSYFTATIFNEVKGIISIIGSPSFVEFCEYKIDKQGWDKNRYMDFLNDLEKHDPIKKINLFKDKKILMVNGSEDEIVPYIWAEKLYEELTINNINPNVDFKLFRCGHSSPEEMKQEVFKWCEEII